MALIFSGHTADLCFIVGHNGKISPYSAKTSTEGSAAWPAPWRSSHTQYNHPALQGNSCCAGEMSPCFVLWARHAKKMLSFLAEEKAGHWWREEAFVEPRRYRATPESAVSPSSPCVKGTVRVRDGAESEAGQLPCVQTLRLARNCCFINPN